MLKSPCSSAMYKSMTTGKHFHYRKQTRCSFSPSLSPPNFCMVLMLTAYILLLSCLEFCNHPSYEWLHGTHTTVLFFFFFFWKNRTFLKLFSQSFKVNQTSKKKNKLFQLKQQTNNAVTVSYKTSLLNYIHMFLTTTKIFNYPNYPMWQ